MQRLNKLATIGVVITLTAFLLGGCNSLSSIEKLQYEKWEESGQLVKKKSPTGALYLGLLPGFGNLYVGNTVLGVADLLIWPISIVYDGPVAREKAFRINYEATSALYPVPTE
jgi:hypothetical protein